MEDIKIKNPVERLVEDDRKYQAELMRRASSAASTLMTEEGFLDVMRLVFDITGYDTVNYSNNQLELAKHNGKREVWGQIKETLFAFNPQALDLIEHHIEEDRKNRGY